MTDITIHSIAGFCNEKVLWKLLFDLSLELPNDTSSSRTVLLPDMVIVDGEDFRISSETPINPTTKFNPPEGIARYGDEGLVWSLGALICYVSSGHYIFGGRGGVYQQTHPKAELPTLRKEHSSLDALIKRCLCYSPSQRISLEELHTLAVKGLEAVSERKRVIIVNEPNVIAVASDDDWPEKMG